MISKSISPEPRIPAPHPPVATPQSDLMQASGMIKKKTRNYQTRIYCLQTGNCQWGNNSSLLSGEERNNAPRFRINTFLKLNQSQIRTPKLANINLKKAGNQNTALISNANGPWSSARFWAPLLGRARQWASPIWRNRPFPARINITEILFSRTALESAPPTRKFIIKERIRIRICDAGLSIKTSRNGQDLE